MTMQKLKAEMTKRGYQPSAGSFEDEQSIHVFSVETHGPDTYNHPKCSLEYVKASGRLYG